MKNKANQKKQRNEKQQKEQTEKEIETAWVEKKKAEAAAMIKAVFEEQELEYARRTERLGRWAPVVEALEDIVHATFEVVEEAVWQSPQQLATVSRVRDAVLARLCNEDGPSASFTDVTFTASVLGQLVDKDFAFGVAALPNALMSAIAATRSVRDAFPRF